jgi:glycosyltransferase involved in cell wall biosynthesis
MARRIWFYELPKPLGLVGWLLEPLYLRALNDRRVITVSESSKRDLQRHCFAAENISIITEGIPMKPIVTLPPIGTKHKQPTVLSLGSIRPMKRMLHQLRAFEIAKASIPALRLEIAGDANSRYGQKFLRAIKESKYATDIKYHGKVSDDARLKLFRKCHALLVTSVKEGWGLVVTEAASQGTPAVVYNVDGLRDSVLHGEAGILAKQNNPQQLAAGIVTILSNQKRYDRLRHKAWTHSQTTTFTQSHTDFKKALNI